MALVKNSEITDTSVLAADEARTSGGESARQRHIRNSNPRSSRTVGDVSGYEDAIEEAEASSDPDAVKYQLAVEIVNSQIGNEQTIGDQEYRDAIDATYDQMSPTVSGAEMRDEAGDPLSGAVRGARDAIDNVNNLVGSGVDWLWDNTAGNLVGGLAALFGGDFDQTKQQVSDWVTPETGAIVSDTLMDLGLSMIPGIGIPLAVGKNAIQQSENIYEGITGVDDITGERLDPGQQIAKLAIGLGTTGLSTIPGIGKARNASSMASNAAPLAEGSERLASSLDDVASDLARRYADASADVSTRASSLGRLLDSNAPQGAIDYMERTGNEAVERMLRAEGALGHARSAAEHAGDVARAGRVAARANQPIAAVDELADMARRYPGQVREGIRSASNAMRQAGSNLASGHGIRAARSVGDAIGGLRDAVLPTPSFMSAVTSSGASSAAGRAAGEAAEGAAKSAAKKDGLSRATDFARGVSRFLMPNSARDAVLGAATPVAMGLASDYAENGGTIDDAMRRLGSYYANNGAIIPAVSGTMLSGLLGGNRMSRFLPSPSGSVTPFNAPLAAARTAAMSNYYTQNPYAQESEETSPEDVLEYLRTMNGGSENG